MIFGIDYDGTFASAPELFREIVRLMRAHGHTPIMVTQRCKKYEAEIQAVVQIPDLPIVFASGKTKVEAAWQRDFKVDVWIDDNPYSISTALRYRGCP